ncbi:FecR family protein [Hymenobacter lucidus]|nr:FecR family protein [Hymenobacter lucidus]
MKPADFQDLLRRYQQGACTPAEKKAVEQWYASLDSGEQLELTPEDQALLKATLWQRITDEASGPPVPDSFQLGQIGRYAAAAIVVLGLGLSAAFWPQLVRDEAKATIARRPAGAALQPGWQLYDNTTSRPVTLKLADGSAVTLAAASQLKYPRQFRGQASRNVYLVGEAFFRVAHNPARPFLVYTDKVVTKVLGTSFTVQAFAGQKEALVLVKTGRVQVTPRASTAASPAQSIIVLPNQQALYRADRQQLTQDLAARPALLTPQSFVFDDKPVAEVLAVLEAAYGVPIKYDKAAFANCTVTLTLSNEPLYDKLDILCKILGASYEKDHTHILLRPGKC